MNKSILLGRLTRDVEIRYSQTNNIKVAKFTLAVNRKYVKEGEERQADFINIVAYGKLADFAEKYLRQGIQICVCGRIQTRTYDDNNGQKHYITEVIAEEIYFADSMKKSQADESILWQQKPANSQNTNNVNSSNEDNTEDFISDPDDLPF